MSEAGALGHGPIYAPRTRALIALGVALASAALVWLRLSQADLVAADFTWAWRGAQLLLAGVDPYAAIRPTGAYPFNDYLYYPLPALLLAVPLAWAPGPLAGAIFIGLSSGLLSWGLLREGAYRLILFASPSYLYALITVQWSPLITAAALLPGLAFVLPAKPNLGLAVLAAFPDRRRLLGAGAAVALSLLIMPSWPLALAGQLGTHLNYTPLLSWYGPLLLLVLPFWRAAPARLLLVMALMPQRLIYDQLPLWLVPQGLRQTMLLTATAWLGLFVGLAFELGALVLPFIYLPALACVIWTQRRRPRG